MADTTAFLFWLLTIEGLSLAVLPLATKVFRNFADRGFAFAKILGILLTSYLVWILGSLKFLPFTRTNTIFVAVAIAVTCWLPKLVIDYKSGRIKKVTRYLLSVTSFPRLILLEELLFIIALAFWSIIRGYGPDIHGLEKYMDYGFVLSILRGKYFPPLDHFLAGETINYYYFGHLICAVLTKLSGIPANITYNLQIANLFALTVLEAFSIGVTLFTNHESRITNHKPSRQTSLLVTRYSLLAGVLASLFTALIGNLHAVTELLKGNWDKYWYPTATRLIPYTIDEFPVYSWVVADLHGHVSDIPIVLLTIGLLISYVLIQTTKPVETQNSKRKTQNLAQSSKLKGFALLTRFCTLPFALCTFLALAIGSMYATNAWDFPIYLGFSGVVFLYLNWRNLPSTSLGVKKVATPEVTFSKLIFETAKPFLLLVTCSLFFYLPYWLTVKPLTKGIGIAHTFSPINLILTLWGFYGFLGISFLAWLFRDKVRQHIRAESIVRGLASLLGVKIKLQKPKLSVIRYPLSVADGFAVLLILYGFLLIILPEIVYMKDIYTPDYYRANTMFKLYFQAWLMLALGTSYGVVRVIKWIKKNPSFFGHLLFTFYFLLFTSVMLYPYVAINSITNRFAHYQGLDGTVYLSRLYPDDASAIEWLSQNVKGQPTILEAVGESYTDYARISANTGLPAVLGWPVHEWLWRGSYDEAGKRTAEVQQIYEGEVEQAQKLLKQYEVKYVFVGQLEQEKYKNLKEEKFKDLGEMVFEKGNTRIYKMN